MLLRLSTTHQPATDLGFLLHKHPDRCQTFDLPYGKAHVFYPEASPERCTAALLLDIDPVALVRGKQAQTLEEYVNDRPYVSSSFMSTAIARLFGTALSGRCAHRETLVEQALPLEVELSSVACRGGDAFIRRAFEPLGYDVEIQRGPLDESMLEWGDSPYATLRLKGTHRLCDVLNHLYVLIPTLDARKHYWVGEAEVEKLLEKGGTWLKDHPEREAITRRYLLHLKSLSRLAIQRLVEDESPDEEGTEQKQAQVEASLEAPIRLHDRRIEQVLQTLKELQCARVLEIGCGEGKVMKRLLEFRGFECVHGSDVSHRCLEMAHQRLKIDRLTDRQRERISLFQASLTYADARFEGYDAILLVEVIEHLDIDRLSSMERVVFDKASPRAVLVTTPNVEFNVKFENLNDDGFRHGDHRFEWTRDEFRSWASRVAETFGFRFTLVAVGDEDPQVGSPCQMAVFER